MLKNYYRFLQLLLIMIITGISFGQSSFVDMTPGTAKIWTVPDNVYSVKVELWGAGGAGGGSITDTREGAGGGGGGYTSKIFAVIPGQIINYSVGAGGKGSTKNGNAGGKSNLTHTPSGSNMIANGGTGGNGNNNRGTGIGIGGTSTGGTTNTSGFNGGAGSYIFLTGNTGGDGGDGGNASGTGGRGKNNDNGDDGDKPGGGGGGGEYKLLSSKQHRSGGNGGDGRLKISYTLTPLININFNGINNYVNLKNEFDFSTDFSIELWIKRNNNLNSKQTLLSKRDTNDLTTGYDLSLIDGILTFKWNDNDGIQSPQTLSDSRWYHVAVTYNSDIYSLYIDGIEVISQPGALPQINSFSALLGATVKASDIPIEYYEGSMDEVRIWKRALTKEQIREMMNQEIEKNGSAVRGSVLKLDINGLNWIDLMGYYQMNQGTTDISAGKLADNSESGNTGSLNNMTSMQLQSAPLPYVSRAAGEWNTPATWLDGDVQQIPNSVGIDGSTAVDWNIVRTQHNVTSGNRATTLLGLLVDANKYSITDDQGLKITKYLKIGDPIIGINAVLDLVDESQLLQPEGSIVDYSGIGTLERDQQGSGNKFNYNYWGSPVSTPGLSNPRTYTLNGMLYDGATPVGWNSGLDGSVAPLKISTRWLYIFENNLSTNYNGWKSINQNSSVNVGHGYLMKGAGAVGSPDQNYTFKGQPNNGVIKRNVPPGQVLTLIGNPYPSAIDADKFILDNEGALSDGKLIFWEQAPSNASHNLKAYEGRYSYYNLLGGLQAASIPLEINGQGNAVKEPGQYIPVGQGFMVTGSIGGGDITFTNVQRTFKKEIDTTSAFFRESKKLPKSIHKTIEKSLPKSNIQRLRLAFTTPEKAIRHLLLGFTIDNSATDGIDYGYDGLNSDTFPSDIAFLIENKKFVIQGVGSYDINKKYLLDMNLGLSGMVEIELTNLENFETPIDVFIHDAVIDSYTKINNGNFQLQLEKGNYTDRFSIVFKEDKTLATIDNDFKEIQVKYLQKTAEIYVKTPASVEVRQVYLINMVGQVVKSWNRTNMNSSDEFKILVKDIPSGNYILKVETNTSSFNKKIIVGF